mgnify:CR=1 FL=1
MRNIQTGNIKYRFKDNKTAGQRACGFIMLWLYRNTVIEKMLCYDGIMNHFLF